MVSNSDPAFAPQRIGEDHTRESLVVALAKCLLIGTGVALAGLAACVSMLLVLLALREMGLLLLLVILPIASYFAWRATGKLLAEEPSRSRGAIALGTRYLVVGASIGLVLKFLMGGWISDTAVFVFLGSVIGTIGGSLGGAFQGWSQSNTEPALSKNQGD